MKADHPVAFKPETVGFKPETAADAWLGLLAARGVEYLFANGGTDFAPVVEACAKGQALGWRMKVVRDEKRQALVNVCLEASYVKTS